MAWSGLAPRSPASLCLGLLLAACSPAATTPTLAARPTTTPAPPSTSVPTISACESRVKTAADIDEMQDTVTDLDPAIRTCASLAELSAATAKYPTALDGVDAGVFVSNRCQYEATLADTAICKALPN